MDRPRQWADRYGASWYRHFDGRPPLDDDNDYRWDGRMWVVDNDRDDGVEIDDSDLEEFEERRRERIARDNEY